MLVSGCCWGGGHGWAMGSVLLLWGCTRWAMCLKIRMKVYRSASLPQLSESCFLKLPAEVPATGAVRNSFSFLGTQK